MGSRRTLELVPNESARKLTFRKRKKSLYKKAEELSTLCGIDVCLIIFPAQKKGRPAQPETWPLDTIEVNRILNKYKATKHTPSVLKRTFDLSHFYDQAEKMEIVDDNAKKLHHDEINFSKELSTWDARIDEFDEDELAALLTSLEAKLEVTTKRIDNIERNQFVVIKQNVSGMVDGYKADSSKKIAHQIVNLVQEKEAPSYFEPYQVIAHQTNSGLCAFNMNSINSTTPMMQPRNEHFPSQHVVRVHRPIAYGTPRNQLLSNNVCTSFTDNFTPAMQLMLPYMQYQMLPSEFHAQNEKRLDEKI